MPAVRPSLFVPSIAGRTRGRSRSKGVSWRNECSCEGSSILIGHCEKSAVRHDTRRLPLRRTRARPPKCALRANALKRQCGTASWFARAPVQIHQGTGKLGQGHHEPSPSSPAQSRPHLNSSVLNVLRTKALRVRPDLSTACFGATGMPNLFSRSWRSLARIFLVVG